MNAPERYFVAAMITRRHRGNIQLLVQDSLDLNTGKVLAEFPGGMSEIQDNGNPEKTLRRETDEETGYRIKDEAEPREVIKLKDPRGGDKIFYHVWRSKCRGHLRTESIKDGNHAISGPRWVDLLVLVESPRFRDSHRLAIPHLNELLKIR